jgi:ketosteroid isomerase-like protein
MASANVDLARSIWAGWEHGDFSATGWAHPQIEFSQADLPGSEKHVGIPEMGAAWREFLKAWEGFRVRADEFRELDEERVVVLGTFSGRGKGSGVDVGQVQMRGVMVFHIRDRRVTRLVTYFNRERGLAELGL